MDRLGLLVDEPRDMTSNLALIYEWMTGADGIRFASGMRTRCLLRRSLYELWNALLKKDEA